MYSRPVCRSANVLRVPGTCAQQPFERHADAFDLLQVLAEDFDADRRADTRGQHVDAGTDRRRDGHLVAGHAKRGVQIARELRERPRLLLGPHPSQAALRPVRGDGAVPAGRISRRPVRSRPQRDDRFDHVQLGGIGRGLRTACFPVHRGDLRKPHDDAVLSRQRSTRFLNRDARERRGHHQQRSLVERRHELRPEALEGRHGRDHEEDRGGDHDDPEPDDQHRNRAGRRR